MAGTLAWQLLCDTDPAKWAALLDAAQHHILRVDTAQAALAGVSHDISTAANWQAVSREMLASQRLHSEESIVSEDDHDAERLLDAIRDTYANFCILPSVHALVAVVWINPRRPGRGISLRAAFGSPVSRETLR